MGFNSGFKGLSAARVLLSF